MKRVVALLMAVLVLQIGAVAQSVTGKIQDAAGEPLGYVTIKLIQPEDSTIIAGGISHEDGSFTLPINTDSHPLPLYLEASLLGYSTVGKSISTLTGHTLVLSEEAALLGEVTITANHIPHKLVPGGLSTSIETSPLAKLDDIYSVLRGVPMVEVSAEDEITITGRGTPIIYINDRLMTNEQQLRLLRPHLVRYVEVITNPSARYSSSTKAVLKIYTRREPGSGLSGELRQNIWNVLQTKLSGSTATNLNYRTGAWDFFTSLYGHSNYGRAPKPFIEVLGKTPEHSWRNRSDFDYRTHNIYLEGNLGFNYEDELRSAGLSYTPSHTPKRDGVSGGTMQSELDGHPAEESHTRAETVDSPDTRHTLALYYLRRFGQWKGQVDINYYGEPLLTTTQRVRDGHTTQYELRDHQIKTGKKTHATGARAEATGPLWGGSLTTGATYSLTQNRYYSYYDKELGFSDYKSEQREQLFALYLEYGRPLSQTWVLSGGLRLEYVDSYFANVSKRTEELTYRKLNVFPTLSLGGALGGWNTQLSFRSVINRPNYWQLNPQYQVISRYEYQIGDPNLRAAISYNTQLLFNKNWLTLMLDHSYHRDRLTQSIFLMPDPKDPTKHLSYTLLLKNINASPYHEVKAIIVASPTIGWWRPTAIAMYDQVLGFPLQRFEESISYRKPLFNFALNNLFTLPYDTTVALNVSYIPPGGSQDNFILNGHNIQTWGEVSKKWLKSKSLTTTFTVRNILNRNNFLIEIPTRYTEMRVQDYSPTYFQLRISYRFNSTKSKSRAKSALTEVMQRL